MIEQMTKYLQMQTCAKKAQTNTVQGLLDLGDIMAKNTIENFHILIYVFIYVGLGASPGNAQGLLLALQAEITLGRALSTGFDTGVPPTELSLLPQQLYIIRMPSDSL